MKVIATFLGSQALATVGFTTGQQYMLTVADVGRYLQVSHDAYPFQKVPYSNWAMFFDSWGSVSKIAAPMTVDRKAA